MSNIKSWDKTVQILPGGHGIAHSSMEAKHKAARLVLWPEGAPDPSEVPHAGEMVRYITYGTKNEHVVRTGIPEKRDGGDWGVRAARGTFLLLNKIERIPDAPTVKIGEKTYDLADAVARCEPLEEV